MGPRSNRDASRLGPLRAAAIGAVLAGAAGSVGFLLHVGQRNQSRLLMVLFSAWVLSPFIALIWAFIWASVLSKRRSMLTRVSLYITMLALTMASLAIYGVVALGPPRAKPAFVFVVVPPVSWMLIAIVVTVAGFISSRRTRQLS